MSRPSFIEPMMVCSTAHVLPATMAWLGSDDCHHAVYANPHGAFVWVPDLGEDEGWPGDLRTVFVMARSYDCQWVKLDCDATEIGGLQTYDWTPAPAAATGGILSVL